VFLIHFAGDKVIWASGGLMEVKPKKLLRKLSKKEKK